MGYRTQETLFHHIGQNKLSSERNKVRGVRKINENGDFAEIASLVTANFDFADTQAVI